MSHSVCRCWSGSGGRSLRSRSCKGSGGEDGNGGEDDGLHFDIGGDGWMDEIVDNSSCGLKEASKCLLSLDCCWSSCWKMMR
jgi:hypothetical protein